MTRTLTGDLLIMADGIWSATATALIGNAPCYRGYGGVLALAGTTSNKPTGGSLELWGTRERFGVFDLAGGDRYWFYIRDQAADAAMPAHAEIANRARRFPDPVAPDAVLKAFEAMRRARIRTLVRQSREGAMGAHGPAPIRCLWRAMLKNLPAGINHRVIATMHCLPDYR